MEFSQPIDRYELIKMERDQYARPQELPPGYTFIQDIDREAERALLQSEFPMWEVPFHRRMPGLADDGVICVAHEGTPVALSYFCDENELGQDGYHQIHYAVVHAQHRGKKLLAAMVTEMFRRRPDAKGGFFYHDRGGHRDMYERWGGSAQGEKPKQKPSAGSGRKLAARVRGKLAGR